MKFMRLPLILVNFKNVPQAIGRNAVRLARICERVAVKHHVNIIVAPSTPDLSQVALMVRDIPVFSQHVDPVKEGYTHTGHVTALTLRAIGITGTLVNHPEHRVGMENIARCIEASKQQGLYVICCAATLDEAESIARLNPNALAYDVPELIGTGRAISKEKPREVKEFVKMLSKINPNVVPLCGAGISTGKDVEAALKLGTQGILVASAVVKAEDPESVLVEFAKACK